MRTKNDWNVTMGANFLPKLAAIQMGAKMVAEIEGWLLKKARVLVVVVV